MPNGARLWGRTTVGVRCTSGHPWTVWLQAKVSVHATYYVAARAMMPGEVVSEADMVSRDGDLTMLPMSSPAAAALTSMPGSMNESDNGSCWTTPWMFSLLRILKSRSATTSQ